jgi:hypothetical protein
MGMRDWKIRVVGLFIRRDEPVLSSKYRNWFELILIIC